MIKKRKPHTEETKRKIGLANSIRLKGKKRSLESRIKQGRTRMGMKHSEETKRKIGLKNSISLKGRNGYWLDKIRPNMKGENNPAWKGGTASKDKILRKSLEYKQWRSDIFLRDNWTCQTCGKRGCYLEPHHIKSWRNYPELRFELNNGVSLCKECHKLTDNYKSKALYEIL